MSIFIKEMKISLKSLCIWTASIGFMLIVCIFMFPQMKNEMNNITDMFSNMGGFTQAFGMDRLNFGELMGFYGVECGNMLGIGGGFFAAFIGITILSKEEKNHTAEFLLTHPVTRASIALQKLLSIIVQILLMNIIIIILSAISIIIIGEDLPVKELLLIHIAYTFLQLEICFICFGISAFIKRGSIGIGLGLAAVFYFMNIIRNISENADFLRFITPFAYADSADIIVKSKLNLLLILLGLIYSAFAVIIGFIKYTHKDIAS